VDRHALARELGFLEASPNSLDAVADRDFVVEYLFIAALIGVHLSRLAEQIVLYTTAEFGFFELSDAFATGSSLMPQKKNPDLFELTRAKAAYLNALLNGAMNLLKALPSAYDKDLQEDKRYVFEATDTLLLLLPVIAAALRELRVHPERMKIDAFMLATDLADELVRQGIPFRQAHRKVGELVRKALEQGISLEQATLQEVATWGAIQPQVVLDPLRSLARREVWGGTAPQAVRAQLQLASSLLKSQNSHS